MKIFAVGMNYIEHNKELHGALYKPEEPVIFTKADSALLKDHKPFFIPDHLGRIDYETELVVRISRLGKTISERFAPLLRRRDGGHRLHRSRVAEETAR